MNEPLHYGNRDNDPISVGDLAWYDSISGSVKVKITGTTNEIVSARVTERKHHTYKAGEILKFRPTFYRKRGSDGNASE